MRSAGSTGICQLQMAVLYTQRLVSTEGLLSTDDTECAIQVRQRLFRRDAENIREVDRPCRWVILISESEVEEAFYW
jgi:hypothetical protein